MNNLKANGEAFISIRKAADLIGMPKSTLHDWIHRSSGTSRGLSVDLLTECIRYYAYKGNTNCQNLLEQLSIHRLNTIKSILAFNFDIEEVKSGKRKNKEGWVYIIKCQDFFKIGVADNVNGRMNGLQTGNPFELTLIMKIKSSKPYNLEKVLHRTFRNKRVRGEWFALDDLDLKKIEVEHYKKLHYY